MFWVPPLKRRCILGTLGRSQVALRVRNYPTKWVLLVPGAVSWLMFGVFSVWELMKNLMILNCADLLKSLE